MIKFTFNNQKEYKSFVTLLYWIEPWLCTKFDYDLGIDLYVQPFDDRDRDPEDNALITFNKRLLIQLKSTGDYDQIKKCHTIDLDHINDWQRQDDMVIFMKYYIPEDTFYYAYIDDIEIKEEQKTQTIELTKKLDKTSIKEFKNEVLDKLSPVKIGEINYIPKLNSDETIYQCFVDLGRKEEFLIDKHGHIKDNQKLLSTINFIKEKITKMYNIDNLKKDIINDDTVDNRLKLIQYLYIEGKHYEAKSELIMLHEKFQSKEAQILLYFLNKNIAYEDLIKIKGVFYLKWVRNIPKGARLIPKAKINNQNYTLTEDYPGIIILPVNNIKSIQLEIKFHASPSTRESPSFQRGSINLFSSFMYENEIFTEIETFIRNIC